MFILLVSNRYASPWFTFMRFMFFMVIAFFCKPSIFFVPFVSFVVTAFLDLDSRVKPENVVRGGEVG